MWLKKTSLKRKLLVIILFTSLTCVLLTSAAITYFGIYNIKQKMIEDLDITANITANRISSFLQFPNEDNSAAIRNSLDALSGDMTRSCVYTASIIDEPAFFTSVIREKDNKRTTCPDVKNVVNNIGKTYFFKDRLQTYVEIRFKDADVVGYMFLESDLREIEGFINDQLMTVAIVILAVSLISYFLATFLQRTISAPIKHLVETTRKVSDQKDYTIRAQNFLYGEDVNRNEISVLIDAFNSMLSEVEERRQMLLKKNQELVKAKDAAESANRAKSQFLANISHELRTPLNAVIGFSDIIMREMLGPIENKKYLEYSKDINDSGEHLLHIINDILDLSKAEAGKLEPVLREISVRKTVDECINLISERAQNAEINVSADIIQGMPPLVVDRVMFKRIMMHLLSNAVKFTNKGGMITIKSEVAKGSDGVTDVFTVEVKDTGIGMSVMDIERAFNSFVQLDGGLNRRYDGTGLGLPICKKFMDLHGGSIRLESEQGKGTSAILTFISRRQV